MAYFETGWGGTGANAVYSGIGTWGADVRIVGDINRVNNTIQFRSTRGQVRITGSNGYFDGMNLRQWVEIPRGALRINDHHYGTGRKHKGDVYETWYGNWDIGVGSDQTSMELNSGAAYGGDGVSWTGGLWIGFGATTAPSGNTHFVSRTDTSLVVRNDVTHWGDYCTAGSVRSYRADNSGFSGQTYIGTSDNANVTHSGLLPNKQYWFRGWADNGVGKSAWMSSTSAITLANATETSKNVLATTVSFVLAVAQGARTTTAKVQYRKVGDTAWIDSTNGTGGTPSIAISGLLPNTQYEYRFAVTTSDGTWTGSTQALTTLPAGKLVMPNGEVKNAITRLVRPDGSVEMVNINLVD